MSKKSIEIEQHKVTGTGLVTIFRGSDIYPDREHGKDYYYVHYTGRNSEYDTFQIHYSKGDILDAFGIVVKI